MTKDPITVWICNYCVSDDIVGRELPCYLIQVGETCSPNRCPESGIHGIVCNWSCVSGKQDIIQLLRTLKNKK